MLFRGFASLKHFKKFEKKDAKNCEQKLNKV